MSKYRTETVTRVIDGNTFLTKERKGLVRLANAVVPRRPFPYWKIARGYLAELIQGKKVHIDTLTRDSFGRSIALVRVGRRSVNELMMRKLKKR